MESTWLQKVIDLVAEHGNANLEVKFYGHKWEVFLTQYDGTGPRVFCNENRHPSLDQAAAEVYGKVQNG